MWLIGGDEYVTVDEVAARADNGSAHRAEERREAATHRMVSRTAALARAAPALAPQAEIDTGEDSD